MKLIQSILRSRKKNSIQEIRKLFFLLCYRNLAVSLSVYPHGVLNLTPVVDKSNTKVSIGGKGYAPRTSGPEESSLS